MVPGVLELDLGARALPVRHSTSRPQGRSFRPAA
jgi:hypothetical protein